MSLDPAAPPTAFAVKFAKVIPGTFSFNEVEVLRTLQARSPGSVLSAYMLRLDPIRSRADGAQLAMIAMEPCDGSLSDLRSSLNGTHRTAGLSPAAAAAVTRAAFEDCASLWAAAQLLHMDVKPDNFLYSCTSATGQADDRTYHVFAADFGSLVREGALCCSTYSSPAAPRVPPPAHWSHVAFQLGAMCFWLLEAPGGSECSCAEFETLQSNLSSRFCTAFCTAELPPGCRGQLLDTAAGPYEGRGRSRGFHPAAQRTDELRRRSDAVPQPGCSANPDAARLSGRRSEDSGHVRCVQPSSRPSRATGQRRRRRRL